MLRRSLSAQRSGCDHGRYRARLMSYGTSSRLRFAMSLALTGSCSTMRADRAAIPPGLVASNNERRSPHPRAPHAVPALRPAEQPVDGPEHQPAPQVAAEPAPAHRPVVATAPVGSHAHPLLGSSCQGWRPPDRRRAGRVSPAPRRLFVAAAAADQAGNLRVIADLVPLEYSIEWLTCAVASRLDAVMVG